MKRGSLIIYDINGGIIYNSGDAEGGVPPWELPETLNYIVTEYGQLNSKILKGVNAETKELITEDMPKVETEAERLAREKQELENQILLMADSQTGGIL